ncbi:hypothetical protein CHS0354_030533 [Potamilus streckersoni]|uniref:Uncharacterized protein n=1 Tax=Potamilus streckersoni TaxID=2493646 RepID=A0AAE0RPQ0_9BIVA|nr:hypothetical protein CHS0354_030533 [Potamilus streckersoni]
MSNDDLDKYITPLEQCQKGSNQSLNGKYCNATWDGITCWYPTPTGQTASQECPLVFSAVEGSRVYKSCQKDGQWATPVLWKGFGHSDYSECVRHINIQDHFDIPSGNGHAAVDVTIMLPANIVDITLLSISFVFIIFSLLAFRFALPKSLRQATQYKVLNNLFVAVLIDVIIKMVDVSLLLLDNTSKEKNNQRISNTPFLCEAIIIFKKYTETVTHMWLLLELHYLQLATKSGRLCITGYMTYCMVGWGLPTVPITVWAVTLSLGNKVRCWPGADSMATIWIAEITKLIIMLFTAGFVALAIWRLFKNLEMLTKSCCFRRNRENLTTSAIFYVFTFISLILGLVHKHIKSDHQSLFGIIVIIFSSSNGVILSFLLCMLNWDIRRRLKKKVRRQSHQELVRNLAEENEL